jgi:hypothetical protein
MKWMVKKLHESNLTKNALKKTKTLIAEKRALGIDGTNGMIATPIEAVCTSN